MNSKLYVEIVVCIPAIVDRHPMLAARWSLSHSPSRQAGRYLMVSHATASDDCDAVRQMRRFWHQFSNGCAFSAGAVVVHSNPAQHADCAMKFCSLAQALTNLGTCRIMLSTDRTAVIASQ